MDFLFEPESLIVLFEFNILVKFLTRSRWTQQNSVS